MKEYETTSIKTMEMIVLNKYKDIIKEQSFVRQMLLKSEKDAILMTLSIMGYSVVCDVDTDLRVTAVHITKNIKGRAFALPFT